jgi:hypothetical protein
MSDVKLQGDFGIAYVKAVAHAAGYSVELAQRANDDAGVDVTLVSLTKTGKRQQPRLDVQVKTTVDELVGDPFTFDLSVKNYDELRDDGPHNLPRILVVISVPPGPGAMGNGLLLPAHSQALWVLGLAARSAGDEQQLDGANQDRPFSVLPPHQPPSDHERPSQG